MKKCPQCGTILEENKKKCYMCGAEFSINSGMDFGNAFDEQVGATVSQGQDNVFNNVDSIAAPVQEAVNNQGNNVTFSGNVSSPNTYQEQVGFQYDSRTSIEKVFSTNRFKGSNEIDSLDALNHNKEKDEKANKKSIPSVKQNANNANPQSNPFAGNTNIPGMNAQVPNVNVTQQIPGIINQPQPMQQQPMNQPMQQGVQGMQPVSSPQQQKVKPPKVKKEKKPKKQKKVKSNQDNRQMITWGDNLRDNYDSPKKKGGGLSINLILNILSFAICIGIVVFVYFKFVNPKVTNEPVNFGGLNYVISDEFILKTDDNFRKYYTYGEDCSIGIVYGPTNNVDGFVENYFENIKSQYTSEQGFVTQLNEMRIDGNLWSSISVLKLQENPAAVGGYSQVTKYRFVTIVYEGNFYEIIYVNPKDDSKCSSMYDAMLQTLAFD